VIFQRNTIIIIVETLLTSHEFMYFSQTSFYYSKFLTLVYRIFVSFQIPYTVKYCSLIKRKNEKKMTKSILIILHISIRI
jgi:hypothetical protein